MVADSPQHAVAMVDEAFHRGGIEAVLDFYEAGAVVVMSPDRLARGRAELREFFDRVMRYGGSARQLKTHMIEADGVALFLSRWTFRAANENDESGRTFVATTVLRRQPDGRWKALIDNSLGPLVLGA